MIGLKSFAKREFEKVKSDTYKYKQQRWDNILSYLEGKNLKPRDFM